MHIMVKPTRSFLVLQRSGQLHDLPNRLTHNLTVLPPSSRGTSWAPVTTAPPAKKDGPRRCNAARSTLIAAAYGTAACTQHAASRAIPRPCKAPLLHRLHNL